MVVKNQKEREILREAGRRLAVIVEQVAKEGKIGTKASDLDNLSYSLIKNTGGAPSFKGYVSNEIEIPFPSCLCVSVNNEIVHCIPTEDKIFKEGDIVSLDLVIKWPFNNLSDINDSSIGALYVDVALTVPIGKISPKAKKIIKVCKKSLDIAISKVKPGNRLGDLGNAVENFVKSQRFKVVRELGGHGVGNSVHENPIVCNFGQANTGMIMKEGMVLALEPMIVAGKDKIILDDNGWTWKTRDKSISAHFEHSVLITKNGVEI